MRAAKQMNPRVVAVEGLLVVGTGVDSGSAVPHLSSPGSDGMELPLAPLVRHRGRYPLPS